MKVPKRAPSSPSMRTSPPGGICRYSGFIAISLENTQGEPGAQPASLPCIEPQCRPVAQRHQDRSSLHLT